MAYNRVNVGNIKKIGKQTFSIKSLSGGLSKYDNGNNNSLSEMSNMVYENGKLVLRGGFLKACDYIDGEFHSILDREYEGNVLFHAGDSIFRFDGSAAHIIAQGVSDTKSVFLSMNGCAYLYTAGFEIYEIKEDFSCEKVQGYVPEILYSSNNSLTEFELKEPINLLSKRIKCSYKYSGIDTFILSLPFEADYDEPIIFYANGVEIDSFKPYYGGVKDMRINSTSKPSSDTVTVEYTVLDEDGTFEKYFNKIYGCEVAFCYGGAANDGTRAFLTANDACRGSYFRSELKNPLYFPETSEEILGDGSEKITAAQKRYEKLYFFTEKHIYSMQYEFSIENGATFPVTEIYSPVGCNMKNTVRSIDNTPVFADRNSGIYILQSTDIFDELNVKHISANLKGSWLVGKDKDAVFAACDFDRKYYISCCGSLFVWDYGLSPYYSDSDYEKAESRLSWYKFDGISGCVYIFSFDGELYYVKSDGKTGIFRYDPESVVDNTDFSDEGQDVGILSSFTTKGYDFGTHHGRKKLCYISFDCAVYEKCGAFEVKFFADGEEFYSIMPPIPSGDCRMKIKLPARFADKFAVKFIFNKARIGISDIDFCYLPTEREKYNL